MANRIAFDDFDRLTHPGSPAIAPIIAPRLSIAEVGKLYNVSRSTIYRRIEDGTLTTYKFGPRIIRLDAAEVAAAFRRQP